jgi:serine protease Do
MGYHRVGSVRAWAHRLGIVLAAAILWGSAVAVPAGSGLARADDLPALELPAVFTKSAPENVADLKALDEHIRKVVDQVTHCVVAVQVRGAQGSGVIVSKDGYVLTAGHVSGRPGAQVSFILHDGRRVQGVSLGRNRDIDSGLCKITDEGEWPCVERGESGSLQPGSWCLALGHPLGYQRNRAPVVRIGRVVSSTSEVVRTDCALVSGDSGGPLFDMQGRVIGIHSRIASPLTANFHVPIDTYNQTWDRLVASEEWGGQPSGPIIGIRGEDTKNGCRIIQVFPGMPAEKAGLKEGDIITAVDGVAVRSLRELVEQFNKHKPGDEVTIEYLRDGEKKSDKMAVVERPQ